MTASRPSWKRRGTARQRALRAGGTIGVAAAALTGAAFVAARNARRAELRYPPKGRFVSCDAVRLHYVERGVGQAVVFLHGSGTMLEDFLISGVIDQTARRYRAIAFDRPGFGHSNRPSDRFWTPSAQASVLLQACRQLGIDRPIVVAHAWGALLALALALDHPHRTAGLVLLSGYYFPKPRRGVALLSPPAIPVLGGILSYTVAPLLGAAIAPTLVERMFAPQGTSPRFKEQFPMALALRPSQIHALAEESAHALTAATRLSPRYRSLFPPAAIIAGDADRIVDVRQAQRLHGEIAGSRIDILRGASHMVHHVAPERVLRAIDAIAREGPTWRSPTT